MNWVCFTITYCVYVIIAGNTVLPEVGRCSRYEERLVVTLYLCSRTHSL